MPTFTAAVATTHMQRQRVFLLQRGRHLFCLLFAPSPLNNEARHPCAQRARARRLRLAALAMALATYCAQPVDPARKRTAAADAVPAREPRGLFGGRAGRAA